MRTHIVVSLAALLAVATGYPEYGSSDYNYESYDYDGTEEESETGVPAKTPQFIDTQQHYTVPVGNDITFPCDVRDLGPYMMFFKTKTLRGRTGSKSDKTIFVGDMDMNVKSGRPSRFSKEGNSYTLKGIRKFDAGEYKCIIEADDGNLQIIHHLDVQYPAVVSRISKETQHVEQGNSVTLECAAEGNPTPTITWSKQGGHMPSGQPSEEGISITLQDVDRYDEGTYTCTASNGIGESSMISMDVLVEYQPEINTEEAILHTGKGNSAKLVCIVHGRPTPTVSWYKGAEPVSIDRHISSHDGAHRHTLTIENVIDKDFGEYTCEANNKYGAASSSLSLTGLPKKAHMTSSSNGGEKNSYTLRWTTESFSRPVQLRIKYRKLENEGSLQAPTNWLSDSKLLTGEQGLELESNGQSHYMRHDIKNLEPATDYEVIVLVENEFGWSSDSDAFHFHTKKEETTTTSTSTTPVPEPIQVEPVKKEVSQGQQAPNSCSLSKISMSIFMLSVAASLL